MTGKAYAQSSLKLSTSGVFLEGIGPLVTITFTTVVLKGRSRRSPPLSWATYMHRIEDSSCFKNRHTGIQVWEEV